MQPSFLGVMFAAAERPSVLKQAPLRCATARGRPFGGSFFDMNRKPACLLTDEMVYLTRDEKIDHFC